MENALFVPLSSKLTEKIETHFSNPAANFLKALILGRRENLDDDILENFQNAGVMHVLAISGLHVGFVAIIFYIFLSFFPIYFKHRNLMVIILLIFYMFLTGSQPPVVRATLMASILLIGINFERKLSIYNSIFAAGFIILILQPQQLFWVGFQFSFSAVLGMIYFYQKLEPVRFRILKLIKSEQLKPVVNKWIIIPFFVSLSAQISTLPLTMHYFHKLSLVSFFLNILVIPFIGLIVTLGFIFLILSFINTTLAVLFATFLDGLIKFLLNIVAGAANLPAAYFYIPRFSLLSIMTYLSIVILIFNLNNKNLRKILGYLSVTLVIISLSTSLLKSKSFNLVVMDVGQGDASLIVTPQQKTILFDTGPGNKFSSSAKQAIFPVINHLGIKHLNALFISHPHLDHMGGTFDLLKYVTVDSVYIPPMVFNYKWYDSLKTIFSEKSIPCRILKIGDKVIIDNETRIYTLGPFPKFSKFRKPSGRNLNNNSLVLLVKHRKHTLFFPGDAEKEVERDLLIWGEILDSDLLKVGHHGSKTSSTENLLAQVTPDYSFISVGENNKFNHPSPIVVERLANFNSEVFRTDRNNAIWFQLNKGKWKKLNWKSD